MKKMEVLLDTLGYQFDNVALLIEALRHRSAGKPHNERLEFLGDSVLNFVIAAELFRRFPEAQEGELSRLRANLVNRETLAELAKNFELGDVVSLGEGELKSGGASRPSILADTVEAVIGAIYLDSDMETVYERIVNWYEYKIENISLTDVLKDPKSLLQELLQGKQLSLPCYTLVGVEGEEHSQKFIIECKVDLLTHVVRGEGTSRRRAEQDAAANVLRELSNE